MKAFQETLLGPIDHSNLKEDFSYDYDPLEIPNFQSEYSIFNPQGPINRNLLI